MVPQKPRIAEVNILEWSSASLSGGINLDLNLTNGLIMKKFQRKDSSKLSISNVVLLAGLYDEHELVSYSSYLGQ
jgi:hypothetical protein